MSSVRPALIALGIFVAFVVAVASLYTYTSISREWLTTCVSIDGIKLRVYVADTEAKRCEGYKFKNSIDFKEVGAKGMLFVWESETPKIVGFTMQNVSFPLLLVHVAYVNGRYIVYNKTLMLPNQMYTFVTVSSYDYFLELDPSFDRYISIGDTVYIEPCYK